MSTPDELWWVVPLSMVSAVAAVLASGHAVLHKRHTRAIVGWLGLLWLLPMVGVVAYVLLGINRVSRKAARLRGRALRGPEYPELPALDEQWVPLASLVGRVSRQALVEGNEVKLLVDGDEAYPAMLEAIEQAERSVALCMYIFEADELGDRFVAALAAAVDRGLAVRVLVDGIGVNYSFPRNAARRLRAAGVWVELFLWSWNPLRMAYLNLRNHRKLLVVDGQLAFTGGMNLRRYHLMSQPEHPTRDLMVSVRGPVVRELLGVFATDWSFTTGERLQGALWYPELPRVGTVIARSLPDGPDEDFGVAVRTFSGALSVARRSVLVLTPYFLPEEELITALEIAALRGVEVDVVVPAHSNQPQVNRAMMAEVGRLVRQGVRIWLAPEPFDHSKLLVVDDGWVCLGSANWDARSLRLNFELNFECYDTELALQAASLIRERRGRAVRLTGPQLDERPLWLRLLDGSLRLLRPYL